MKQRQQLKKQSQTGDVLMTLENLKICVRNQEGYETLYLNDSLHLQYYNFANIDNLEGFVYKNVEKQTQEQTDQLSQEIKGINTVFLNNNLIERIQNLSPLSGSLVTLNLSHNKIKTFQGLVQLRNLVVLDLSYNLIKEIQENEIKNLNKLNRLNLAANLFTSTQSIKAITSLKESLESLDLSSNNAFSPEAEEVLHEVFVKFSKMKVMVLKQTPLVRMTSAYRKKVILAVQSLTFLDDRPVTHDQRLLAKAWSQGGLKAQNQARKALRFNKQQKNKKIMSDIQERQKVVNQKAQKLFSIRGEKQIAQLAKLKQLIQTEDFQLMNTGQQALLRLKIDELERYLQLLREQCAQSHLDKELGLDQSTKLPKMLIEKRTADCIFVYNVDESLIHELKKKYYPEEILPIKVVNYEKPQQIEWISEYDHILEKTYQLSKGNWEIIVPAFNLDIYDFDETSNRKLRRFSETQLKNKFALLNNSHSQEQIEDRNFTHVNSSAMGSNELDCLD